MCVYVCVTHIYGNELTDYITYLNCSLFSLPPIIISQIFLLNYDLIA